MHFVCFVVQMQQAANSLARFVVRGYSYGQVSGSNSAVECQLPKLDVAGSIPVSRSSLTLISLQLTMLFPSVFFPL